MQTIWPAVLLAWVAGFVDALGYLALSHVFTAHMSGNAASLGAHLGRAEWREALIRGWAILPFILGVGLGAVAEAIARQKRFRASAAVALGLEFLCLGAVIWLYCAGTSKNVSALTPKFFLLSGLLSFAMGLQNAALRHAGDTKVRTTFVTGMLTDMTEHAARHFIRHCMFSGNPSGNAPDERAGRLALNFGLIFIFFMIGAACGGYAQTAWGAISLLAPMTALLVLIVQNWHKTDLR